MTQLVVLGVLDYNMVVQMFVQVSIFAANMSATNWASPTSFGPERWIAPYGEYAQDQRQSLQPFSLGARVCIGKQ